VLHDISRTVVDHDILRFLLYSLGIVRQERYPDIRWPREEVISRLVQYADGLFIWASTAYLFIRKGKRFTAKRLATILDRSNASVYAPKKQLDEIYTTVLRHSVSDKYTKEEQVELFDTVRHILRSVVLLLAPLSIHSVSALLRVPRNEINQTLEDLHAILDIPKD
jgi:hypothetical protein